jgi:hypothetical protein
MARRLKRRFRSLRASQQTMTTMRTNAVTAIGRRAYASMNGPSLTCVGLFGGRPRSIPFGNCFGNCRLIEDSTYEEGRCDAPSQPHR